MGQNNLNLQKIGLSILRVIACLAVFIVHLGQRVSLHGIIREVTDTGAYGVQMFFVLSGFLACFSLEKSNNNHLFRKNVFIYYKKRIVRLLPLYYLCIVFYFITETFIWKSVPEDVYGLYWLRYVFLLNAYIPADNSFWSNLGATWTIPVFFLFYLLIPFLQRFFNSLKKSLVLFVISVILALGIKYLFQGFLKGFMDLPFFILGMLAYYAVKEQEKDLVILGCVAGTLYGQFVDKGWSFAFASVILVLVLYDYQFSNNRIVSVINTLDKYSYGIYLLHCV